MEQVGTRAAWITGWDLRVPKGLVEKCGGKVYRLWRPTKDPKRTKGIAVAWEPDDGDTLLYVGRTQYTCDSYAEYYILHRADSGRAVVLCKCYINGKYKLRRVD